jgi:hypothetical protein
MDLLYSISVCFFFYILIFGVLTPLSWRPVLVVEEARTEPPTMGKQLVNFITCDCESNAPF